MKKKILVSLLAVVLIVVGAGGGVYAVDHEPIEGNKLIGYGALGTHMLGPCESLSYTVFVFT